MNKKVYFFLMVFSFIFCFRSINLPRDFEIKCSLWINLMPSPPSRNPAEKIKGIIEFKGSLKKEIKMMEVHLFKGKEKFEIEFEKNGEKIYVLKNLPFLIPGENVNFLIKFKYGNKEFEKEIHDIKVGVIY